MTYWRRCATLADGFYRKIHHKAIAAEQRMHDTIVYYRHMPMCRRSTDSKHTSSMLLGSPTVTNSGLHMDLIFS